MRCCANYENILMVGWNVEKYLNVEQTIIYSKSTSKALIIRERKIPL